MLRALVCGVVCAQLAAVPVGWAAAEENSTAKAAAAGVETKKLGNDPVLKVMQTELSRANTGVGKDGAGAVLPELYDLRSGFRGAGRGLRQLVDGCGSRDGGRRT